MEKDLNTDAVGKPPRSVKEHTDLPQNQSVTLQSQRNIFPDLSGTETRTEHVTSCPHEMSNSASDLTDISFDPTQIKDEPEYPNNVQDLPGTDLTNTASDPGQTKQDSPTGLLEGSCNDHIAKQSNKLEPVQSMKSKTVEDLRPNENVIIDERDHLLNTNSVIYDRTRRPMHFPPKPPLEWRLNELLKEIATSIGPEEFSIIKLMFSGPESIGKKYLEQCDTCFKLFIILKERGYISRDNILYLNKVLYILGRKDLIKRAAQYCHDEGDVIHYYSVQGEPNTGSRNIKIHVVTDVSKCDQETIDRLRNIVASIVCAPPEVVIISAVEPGSSFLITLTMPDMYVDALKDILEQKIPLRRIAAIGADKIIIDGVHYAVSGQNDELSPTEQNKEIMNVYEQLEDKRRELEQMEIANTKCREEMNNVKIQLEKTETRVNNADYIERVNHELSTTCAMLQSMHLTSDITESALAEFQLLMKEAVAKGQDMDLLKEIVRSTAELMSAYHRHANETEREEQRIKLKKRKMNEMMLRQQLLSNLKSAEEVLSIKYSHQTLDTNLELNLNSTKSLNDISEKLTGNEKSILMRKFTWSKDDLIKACIETDERLLLLGLECKEAERTQKRIDTGKFLQVYGREIERNLLSMFNEAVEQHKEEKIEMQRKELNVQLIQQLKSKTESPENIILLYSEKLVVLANVGATVFAIDCKRASVQPLIRICKGLIHFLNDEEIANLTKSCVWQKEDAIQACIEEDKSLLFPGLMCKELERFGRFIPPDQLIRNLQMKIERKDLLMLFMQLNPNATEQEKQIKIWEERTENELELFQRLKTGKTSPEDALLQKFISYTLKLGNEVEITPNFEKLAKLLSDLSVQFSSEESIQLIRRYVWNETDVVKASVSANKKLLLQGLWCKETEITQQIPNIGQFFSIIFLEVKRTDLLEQFRKKQKVLRIDETILHHIIDKTAEYMSNSPKIQGHRENKQNEYNEAGATSIPKTSESMQTTNAAAMGYLPSYVM